MHAESVGELIVAEPKATYAARPPLVVDCSVLVAILFDEPAREQATRLLADHALFAPHLLDYEMIHVAVKKSADGRAEDARQALADLAGMSISRHAVLLRAQLRTALEHELSSYDAAYLQLALDLGAPLATFDQRLGEAARRAFTG